MSLPDAQPPSLWGSTMLLAICSLPLSVATAWASDGAAAGVLHFMLGVLHSMLGVLLGHLRDLEAPHAVRDRALALRRQRRRAVELAREDLGAIRY